jgi:hypothetical protein
MKYPSVALAGACALVSLATPSAALAAPGPFDGRVWHVAVPGLDSALCGTAVTPCRSITQAMANAANGDTILVRPGRYGDIDSNGQVSGAGEEGPDYGAVAINKRLRVLSTDGAAATIIDVSGARQAVVLINAAGAQFGDKGAGFTVTGGWLQGITNGDGTNLLIAGNIVRAIPDATDLISATGMYINTTSVVEIRDNLVIDNPGVGIVIVPQNASSYASVHDNVVTGSHAAEGSVGIVGSGSNPHLIYRNTVVDNTTGILVNYGASRISNNIVTSNVFGVRIDGMPATTPLRGPTIYRNSISSSQNTGLFIANGIAGAITIRENNFYGGATDCGVGNFSAQGIDARNNFWGAATGPATLDPADHANCGGGGVVSTTPFSTREFSVR